MTAEEQLGLWVNGTPRHMGGKRRGQCCPDFSCCRPDLLAPREVRELFAAAWRSQNDTVIERMLMEFLGKGIAQLSKKVHIAGLEASRQEIGPGESL